MAELSDTQQKILEVGKKEFLKYGFKGASLRGIVKTAGFTQGAFYGYYTDKSALFDALVSDAADSLMSQFRKVQEEHYDLINVDKSAESRNLSTDYLDYFINYIYDNFDAFKLVACCADGTRYENYIHELVEIKVCQTEQYYAKLRELGKLEGSVCHELHHMITSAYFTAVFETVVHGMTREKAIEYAHELATFFNCGWDGLLRLK